MKILVIGSGGREHALCWKLRQSSKLSALHCAPGNAGIAQIAHTVAIAPSKIDELVAYAKNQAIDLTVIGPELPLSLGIVDAFQAANLRVVGPSKAAAELESSKSFAKTIMSEARVPTARYEVFTDLTAAQKFLEVTPGRWVLKADGLAAGKGVVVAADRAEALNALPQVFAIPGTTKVVIEEFLPGREASFIVAANGSEAVPLLPAHDYKRIFDGDTGPNTGGMGTVCPTPRMSTAQITQTMELVVQPTLRRMAERGTPFRGFLFAGLMLSPEGAVHVLEFNVRLGDPETQSILTMLGSDLVDLLLWMSEQKPSALPTLQWRTGAAVCVVAAAAGYPEAPRFQDSIEGMELCQSFSGASIFHAGTARNDQGVLVTAGGRVLNIVGYGGSLEQARRVAYQCCDMIQFRGKQVRRDIGA